MQQLRQLGDIGRDPPWLIAMISRAGQKNVACVDPHQKHPCAGAVGFFVLEKKL